MAAANEVIKVFLHTKIPIGTGRAIYLGTATGGSEYATGGVTLSEETGSRYKPPERCDNITISAIGLTPYFIAPNKVGIGKAEATEAGGTQIGAAKTMATAIPAGTVIQIVGDA